jgi:hypothetical protein
MDEATVSNDSIHDTGDMRIERIVGEDLVDGREHSGVVGERGCSSLCRPRGRSLQLHPHAEGCRRAKHQGQATSRSRVAMIGFSHEIAPVSNIPSTISESISANNENRQ